MYILVKEDLPEGIPQVAIAHASLVCYLEWNEDPHMKDWLDNSFRKVVCKVNDKEFENAKKVAGCSIITESSLEGKEVALAFCPREDFPKMFKYYKLYK